MAARWGEASGAEARPLVHSLNPILMVNRLGVSRSRPPAEVASSPFVAEDTTRPSTGSARSQRAVSVRSACGQRAVSVRSADTDLPAEFKALPLMVCGSDPAGAWRALSVRSACASFLGSPNESLRTLRWRFLRTSRLGHPCL